MSDYRCTPYCPPFKDVKEKKTALLGEIRKTHPRACNIYNIVNIRGSVEHRAFFQIYNGKCCYCGCSFKVLSAQLFEVDHLKPKTGPAKKKENLHMLNNLVLACRTCNGGKLNYWFNELSQEWNPDNDGITQLFIRDNLYNILIDDKYQSNTDVNDLYRYLKLGSQFRRLDYLLMTMYGYIQTLPRETEKAISLLRVYTLLLEKRNIIGI